MKTSEKYAPKNLNEIIFPNHAVQTRIQAYATGQLEGNILLYGPNGTAKTSLAKLLFESIGGPDTVFDDMDCEELLKDPAVLEKINNSCAYAPFTYQRKYFLLLNEFDNAKTNVFKLWNLMDKNANNLMVIITTNEPMKVHRSIRSRCCEIEMRAPTAKMVLPRAQQIMTAEGLQLPDAQLLHYLYTKEYAGDLRKYFAVLDELLYLHSIGAPMPHWATVQPKMTVLSGV